MTFPPTLATHLTEEIMSGLRKSGVLKEDAPGNPHNYNCAFSLVYKILEAEDMLAVSPSPKPKAAKIKDIDYNPFPPAVHGNISHGYITGCSICEAEGVKRFKQTKESNE